MKPKDLEAVKRMYNALMAIGAIHTSQAGGCSYSGSIEWGFRRTQAIANACLKDMNSEHTQLIAKAIGIGK